MRLQCVQNFIDKFRGKYPKEVKQFKDVLPKTTRKISKNFQVVAISGCFYSGSSAVIDLLSEFDLSTVIGFREIFSGDQKENNKNDNEVEFFTDKMSIFNLIDAYLYKTDLEKDLAIKQFIYCIYKYYDENTCTDIYNQKFLKVSKNFIENILDLSPETIEIMKDKRYPYVFESDDESLNNCNFLYGSGLTRYIYYQFKNISENEFNQNVCDYFYDFFTSISESGYIICDQLISQTMLLDRFNFYMNEHPIKEITVYRDPRDQFLSAFRRDIFGYLPRTVESFEHFYQTFCLQKIGTISENRLPIKFEDLVLKYDATVDKIIKFLGISKEMHIYPKKYFNPNISKINIGAYKEFIDNDFMKDIAKKLEISDTDIQI